MEKSWRCSIRARQERYVEPRNRRRGRRVFVPLGAGRYGALIAKQPLDNEMFQVTAGPAVFVVKECSRTNRLVADGVLGQVEVCGARRSAAHEILVFGKVFGEKIGAGVAAKRCSSDESKRGSNGPDRTKCTECLHNRCVLPCERDVNLNHVLMSATILPDDNLLATCEVQKVRFADGVET